MGLRLEVFLVLGIFVISGLGGDSGCDVGYTCLSSETCVSYNSKLEDLRKVEAEKGKTSSEYNATLTRLKSLICNKPERKVCCDKAKQSDEKSLPNFIPNIDRGECGVTGVAAFISGGENAKLGEFPWLALLRKVRSDRKVRWHCGGTLLNKWFVLTAAQCGPTVDFVRLGEWRVVDTSKFDEEGDLGDGDIDCEEDTCSAPHQDIRVDKVIIHPKYGKSPSGLTINDVMLIKLSQPVEYNTWVRPACLPDLNLTSQLGEPGHTPPPMVKADMVVWNWKYEENNIVPTAAQQKLKVPLISSEDCLTKYYEDLGVNLRGEFSTSMHLCGGGQQGEDGCKVGKANAGGPLLSREDSVSPFMVVGVLSGGTGRCGIGGPDFFTRVSNYRQWIIDSM